MMVAIKYEKDNLLINKLERKKEVIRTDNKITEKNKELIQRNKN